MKCPKHYLTDMLEVVLFYNGLDVPTRQIQDSKGAIPSKTAANVKTAIQEMAEYSQKWHNEISSRTRSCDDWREAQDVKILDTYDHFLPQKEKDPGSFTLPCFIHNIYFDKALVDLSVALCHYLPTPTLVQEFYLTLGGVMTTSCGKNLGLGARRDNCAILADSFASVSLSSQLRTFQKMFLDVTRV
ncbi:hypothetical protein Tco_1503550 [Tanacetum coccineum]